MKPELTVIKINNPYLLNNASIPEGTGYQSNQPVLSKDGGFWSDDEPEEVGW